MLTVKAAQHIYGHVGREFSPTRTDGFQTLYYTRACLSASDAELIEEKMLYFTSETNPVKLVFFGLSGGRFVFSRLMAIPERDKGGRSGRYIAHSLVLSADDFAKFGCNPFVVFEVFKTDYASTLAETLEAGTLKEGDIGEITRDTPEEMVIALQTTLPAVARKWEPAELVKLVHFAIVSSSMAKDRKSLAFIGSTEDAEDVLRMLFHLIPQEARTHCSFDTYSYKCPRNNYYWAFSYLQATGASTDLVSVNAAARMVQSSAPQSSSPYENWLFSEINQRRLHQIVPNHMHAAELELLLSGRPCRRDTFKGVSPQFLDDFLKANPSAVATALQRTLQTSIGPGLSAHLSQRLQRKYQTGDAERLLNALLDGFDLSEIADELHDVFRSTEPSKQDISDLREFVKRVEHNQLQLCLAVWIGDSNEVRRRLGLLTASEYQEAIELFVRKSGIRLEQLVLPNRADSFARSFIKAARNDPRLVEQAPDLMRTFVTLHSESTLAVMSPFLKDLDVAQLNSVKRIVDRQPNVPEGFLKVLSLYLSYRAKDWVRLKSHLEGLPDDEYRAVVEDFLENGGATVEWLVSQRTLNAFLDVFVSTSRRNARLKQQIPDVVRAVLRLHLEDATERLSPLTRDLQPDQLLSVRQAIDQVVEAVKASLAPIETGQRPKGPHIPRLNFLGKQR